VRPVRSGRIVMGADPGWSHAGQEFPEWAHPSATEWLHGTNQLLGLEPPGGYHAVTARDIGPMKICLSAKNTRETNFMAYSLQANRPDWAIANGRRILVSTFADRGVSSGQRDRSLRPSISGFLDQSRYYFIKVSPQMCSRSRVDPVPDPWLLKKADSSGNRTRELWICIQEF
jgi:hypothetical protein